jgi:hypothetical protein
MTMADLHGDPRDPKDPTKPEPEAPWSLRPTDDTQLTCIVCGEAWVDFEFYSRTDTRRQFQGIHTRCAETIGPLA